MIVAYGDSTLQTEDVRDSTHELVAKYYPGEPQRVEAHMERIFNIPDSRVLIEVSPSEIIICKLDE